MSKRIDLIGQRFGRVIIMSFSHIGKNRHAYWIGICDCGNITKPISQGHLKSGNITSCGCYSKERTSEMGTKTARDITGQIFGYTTAIRPTNKRSSGSIIWECSCICGNIHETSINHLQSGDTTSCGCRTISKLHEDTKQALLDLEIEIYAEEFPIPQKYFTFDDRTSSLKIDIMVWSPLKEKGLIAIECQGEQHYKSIKGWGDGEKGYKKRLENDALKKACLKIMNIPLIEVRYDEPYIEEYLKKLLT